MGKKGSVYERELKAILEGDEKFVNRITKSVEGMGYLGYRSIIKKPFMVIRAAGSFGVDLIAIRGDIAFPIEVKSSGDKVIRFSQSNARAQRQALDFAEYCMRSGVVGLYAFRLKGVRGDPWRIFALPVDEGTLTGKPRLVYRILPKIETTHSGNFVLRWDEGMALGIFLSYINHEVSNEHSVE